MQRCKWMLVLLAALSALAQATPSGVDTDVASRANARVESIRSVDDYLAGIGDAVALAEQGGYGALRSRDEDRLAQAHAQILRLLQGRASALELPLAQRIELYNAQEALVAILRSDDKSRVVCRRIANTGTRIPTTECLSIAERERRARGARLAADKLPRATCMADHDC
jgi:hypothetical protein